MRKVHVLIEGWSVVRCKGNGERAGSSEVGKEMEDNKNGLK